MLIYYRTRPKFCLILAAELLFTGLVRPEWSAATPATDPDSRPTSALRPTTKEELLLFWEEKDIQVQTPTRAAKPISQTAENISVVTAKDIEDMNAHSLAEVLNRVTGLFVVFQGQDFVSPSLLRIQGSEPRHVTVLIDGVALNSLSEGAAETSVIPVNVIDRIEILKEPASSAWGSALGGVINIITKNADDAAAPKVTASGSYGEANSQDYGAQFNGKTGPLGYYLFAGRQQSDGLKDNRAFAAYKFYAKLKAAPSGDMDLRFSIGYSNPFSNNGSNPNLGAKATVDLADFFITGALDYRLTPELTLLAGGHARTMRFDQPVSDLNDQFLERIIISEQTLAGSLQLIHAGDMQTAVAGLDISDNTMDTTLLFGPPFTGPPFNKPPGSRVNVRQGKWALFANDTLSLGNLAATPGIRYDRSTISGGFVSPSLSVSHMLGERVIARASAARGFTAPPLGLSSSGGFFVVPNPSLNPEYGWSYQAGVESDVTDYANVKAALFRHETSNAIIADSSVRFATIFRNERRVIRRGYELEAKTAPVYRFSLTAGHAYARVAAPPQTTEFPLTYSYSVGLKYDDQRSWLTLLTGYYVWWSAPASQNARHNTFIWDLNLRKRFLARKKWSADIVMTVHNIFSGDYYTSNVFPNPHRWVEAGLRLRL
ncbi:MAG TPA: hypothetical protein DEB40_01745 [Elusimicrobia bacterium]|nr:hypothetical protein [Elusimicrobiota bacterium]HBT60453.1 hypothetical protein [Elusimicrobiota bacterium]